MGFTYLFIGRETWSLLLAFDLQKPRCLWRKARSHSNRHQIQENTDDSDKSKASLPPTSAKGPLDRNQ